MKMLHERARPKSWDEVVGQDAAVTACRRLAREGLGGRAVWISGKSGQGKDTIARLLAAEVADPFYVETIDAQELTPARVAALEDGFAYYSFGRGGRAVIVSEAHGLRRDGMKALLVALERIPGHVLWVFTTTADGQDMLFEDKADAGPLVGRCVPIRLSQRPGAKECAAWLKGVAEREHLDGQPVEKYVRLLNECGGSLRMALSRIEGGEMLTG